jgi:hypothetical protein
MLVALPMPDHRHALARKNRAQLSRIQWFPSRVACPAVILAQDRSQVTYWLRAGRKQLAAAFY